MGEGRRGRGKTLEMAKGISPPQGRGVKGEISRDRAPLLWVGGGGAGGWRRGLALGCVGWEEDNAAMVYYSLRGAFRDT